MADLAAALCLVVVIEGLFLLASPSGWKRIAARVAGQDDRRLRIVGGIMVATGLVLLHVAR